ncbi:MAG: hypothetical protein HKM24_03245, partial [Gammaproteobacteria bacterium]|nr:hypothetical protein [Gammaproteobacteria bacterium]
MTHSNVIEYRQPEHSRQSYWPLLALTLIMFGFGFALVPIYNVFCDITGLNRSFEPVVRPAGVGNTSPAITRLVTVELVSADAPTSVWSARPTRPNLQVQPGQLYST